MKKWFVEVSDMALCFARKWWRPAICIGMAGSILVNGIALPLMTRTYPDLVGLAAVVAALAPFAWFRTQEKIKRAD